MNHSGLVVITGGAGFIGSHLAEALIAEGYRVRVVDNLSTGKLSNLAHLGGKFEYRDADLSDPDACSMAVVGAEFVLHQAAIPSVPFSVKEPGISNAAGPIATMHLIEAARVAGVRRFLFAASSSAYGETEELPKHEEMLPRPLSPYAAGKLTGESYVRVYAQTMGFDGASLRYFNVFGPRQDPGSPYSGVISLFAREMAAGRRPRILGDGLQSRDFTYVDNVVHANLLALRSPNPLAGAVFNVGTGRRITLIELVSAINSVLGTDLDPEFGPVRVGDVMHSQASLARIESALGYRPIVDFESGLEKTLAATKPA